MEQIKESSHSSDNSSRDYIASPNSQKLLKQASISYNDLCVHINKQISEERLKRILTGQEHLKQGRYLVNGLIGRGAFGKVFRGTDQQSGSQVAIKMIPNKSESARREIAMLRSLNKIDSEKGFVVRLLDHFKWQGFTFLVFEHLSKTLYQVIRDTGFKGLPLSDVRVFAWQIVMALYLLSHPKLQIMHCDLKPENVMLKDPQMSGIKLIDFGSSCKSGEKCYRYVQSRYYRAPEVLLELNYDQAIDVWSAGCILAELFIGCPLFSGHSQSDQMNKIVQVRGVPPRHMLVASRKTPKFFRLAEGQFVCKQRVGENKNLRTALELGHGDEHYEHFLDLVDKMLVYEPELRITPKQALEHQFFQDGNTSNHCRFQVPPLRKESKTPKPMTPYFKVNDYRHTPFPGLPIFERYSDCSKQSTEVSGTTSVMPLRISSAEKSYGWAAELFRCNSMDTSKEDNY